ncbi:phosphotransferase [Brevibacterium sp. RIT 803]|uniref:phosphotransferase n=1 Tax=Brevibacterium sp. RIT 803 TaxID=2810210 RepID=UPI00194E4883|nr:phosphotransferase [Brevibacterium sp. RIT 803]MBM6589468.1 phosphotransferase [Brevibacterium sp. RIT 803]
MTSRIISDVVTVDGETWAVRRAWPASRNRIAIEAKKNSAIRAGFLCAGHVDMLDAGRDPKLPGLERLLASAGNQLISHRPGKRAVIRLADGGFAKCVRSARAADIIAGQDRAESFRNGFALPNVVSADDSAVVLSALPGVELHDPQRLGAEWSRAWTDALDAWALAAGEAVSSMPVHSAASEVQVLEEWRDRAYEFLGSQLPEIDSLIEDVRADLLDSRAASAGEENAGERNWGPIHRDLHDKQIMWDPVAGPGLLDVDTACLGERELDLGNLRAHARWRTQQGIWTPDDAEAVVQEISRVTSASGLGPRRVRTYERSALVRLACVYAFRPRWSSLTGVLLDAAHE